MSRDLGEVVDQMLEHVPEEEKTLRSNLGEIRRRVGYTAPELMQGMWVATHSILVKGLCTDDMDKLDGWKLEVAKVFKGE